MTANGMPFSTPKSKMLRMFGWDRAATDCASRSNRARAAGSVASDEGSTLIANVPIQLRIASSIHLPHAAGPDSRQNLVRTEPGSG